MGSQEETANEFSVESDASEAAAVIRSVAPSPAPAVPVVKIAVAGEKEIEEEEREYQAFLKNGRVAALVSPFLIQKRKQNAWACSLCRKMMFASKRSCWLHVA